MNAKPSVASSRATLPPLLASFRRHLAAENARPATISHYVGASLQFLEFAESRGFPSIENVAREHVETWLEDLHGRYASASVKNRYNGLRAFTKWLLAEGEVERDPMARTRPPKVDEASKDIAPPELIRAALDRLERQAEAWEKAHKGKALKRIPIERRDAAIIAVFYDTGVRAGELARALLADVDLDHGLLRLPGADTKGRRARTVRLSAEAVQYLDRYFRKRPRGLPGEDHLFSGQRGPLTREGLYDVVRKAFAAAGSTAVISPHDLRHTSASHAADTLSESEMMALYGWKDADMARHYTAQVREQLALRAHERASPLRRLKGS